jgi:hypothetical protein
VPPAPFSSPQALRAAFAAGLSRLVKTQSGLGPFILALNNAVFDPIVRACLGADLERRFMDLAVACRTTLREGRDPNEPADDLAVFLRLLAIGWSDLPTVRRRRVGPWELQFNPLRGLRPARVAGGQPQTNRAPFDPKGFHFNKPFLRREAFWEGRLAGVEVELLYNKFPFVDLHSLLVPRRLENAPQFLHPHHHEVAWAITLALGETLPGVGLGYNSYGAFASVNHLHFQLFLRPDSDSNSDPAPLPLADPCWVHNGGDLTYPLPCIACEAPGAAWDAISRLHQKGQSYNLVYVPGRLYCLPRRRQGAYSVPAWCGGQAWYELSGGVVALNAETFAALGPQDIWEAIAAAAPEP